MKIFLTLIKKIIDYYKENEEKKRLGRFIDHIGFEKFKENLII